MNITRTPWASAPSLPIPDTTYPKKEPMSPPRIRHYRLPHSPKHPGTDTGEDPHHQMTREITVEHDHKALLPPTKPEHDTTLCVLLGSFRHEASTSVSSALRRRNGVDRGQFKFDQEPCFFLSYYGCIRIIKKGGESRDRFFTESGVTSPTHKLLVSYPLSLGIPFPHST